jgi:very-short-patch-repair endonuclease
MPYDIDTSRTQYEGPQLLRDYIDYAINGIQTICTDEPTPSSEHLDLGISFEKSVHDFLLAHGFNVDTNVGCSGYRIDFALRHPDYPGSYAVGIECDGLAYGQARTARDRDRQRQSVLSSMGWQLYRIWSTDWIKDPQAEGARLIEAIEDAFTNHCLQQISGVLTPPVANLTDSQEPATAPGSPSLDSGELATASGELAFDSGELTTASGSPALNSGEPAAAEPPANPVAAVSPASPAAAVPLASQVDAKPLIDQPALDYLEITTRTDSSLPQSRFIGQSADRIPIEDFQRIMLAIVAESYGLDQEGLFRMTARCYGWQRRGSLINGRLAQAYNLLIRTGKLREIEGKISLVEGF